MLLNEVMLKYAQTVTNTNMKTYKLVKIQKIKSKLSQMSYYVPDQPNHLRQWKDTANLEGPDQALLTFQFQSFHLKCKTRIITYSTAFMKGPESYLQCYQVFDIHQIVSQI